MQDLLNIIGWTMFVLMAIPFNALLFYLIFKILTGSRFHTIGENLGGRWDE